MTPAESAVLEAALAWWRAHRPVGWTTDDHLRAPDINARSTPGDQRLAIAVSNIVQPRDELINERLIEIVPGQRR